MKKYIAIFALMVLAFGQVNSQCLPSQIVPYGAFDTLHDSPSLISCMPSGCVMSAQALVGIDDTTQALVISTSAPTSIRVTIIQDCHLVGLDTCVFVNPFLSPPIDFYYDLNNLPGQWMVIVQWDAMMQAYMRTQTSYAPNTLAPFIDTDTLCPVGNIVALDNPAEVELPYIDIVTRQPVKKEFLQRGRAYLQGKKKVVIY